MGCIALLWQTYDEVNKLIAGVDVYICDECIEICNDILNEETSDPDSKRITN